MTATERYRAYRRVIAAPDDTEVCWWYSGWTALQVEGYPDLPVSQIAAIMTYRAETLSPDRFRIHWSEVGVFRDPVTGELPVSWTNPLSGAQIELPRTFREGPGTYTLTCTTDGVAVELEQPNAQVLDTQVEFHFGAERCWFSQTERKIRGVPLADGSMSPLASSGLSGVTQLAFFASAADALGTSSEFVPASGTYSFRLAAIPPSFGFGQQSGACRTWGTISKALPGQKLDRTSWERIAQFFPRDV